MTDQLRMASTPFGNPQWLLSAAKKHSGVPSQAFLDKLQHTHNHPDEVNQKLREDAVRSGRDPEGFAKMLARMKKNFAPTMLAQRSKEVSARVNMEEAKALFSNKELSETEKFREQADALGLAAVRTLPRSAPRYHPCNLKATTATCSTELPFLASRQTQTQRRVTAKGQIMKPTQVRGRNKQTGGKEPAKKKPGTDQSSNIASGTPSLVDVGNAQSIAGPAACSMLANSDPSATRLAFEPYPFPARHELPAWYTAVPQRSLSQFDRRRPQELAAIDALKDCIRRCELEDRKNVLAKEYNDLRDHVHRAEIKLHMDNIKAKKTRILTEKGLPRIFDEHANFPWDLKADAWYLYEKWMNEDFEHDILRGIMTVKGKDRNGDRLDRAYTAKHPKDARIVGNNGAVIGQWWPSQLCAVRDGVHGATQGGIFGDKDRGAFSIVLSSGGYHDRDEGDTVEYSGTEGSNYEIKAATQSMITSAKVGNDIRVLRSSQLPKSNRFRPSCGLRYDGLYQIKSYDEVDLEKQSYRFHLERKPYQEPIRFEGDTKRPTIFEEEAYEKCKGIV